MKERNAAYLAVLQCGGRETFICLRDTSHAETERTRIVQKPGATISEDIRSNFFDSATYPPANKFLDNIADNIPDTLISFLDSVMIPRKESKSLLTKRNSIAHAIITEARPRTFCSPLQLATGTYIHRKSGSRLIVDVLSRLGFCATYNDIL